MQVCIGHAQIWETEDSVGVWNGEDAGYHFPVLQRVELHEGRVLLFEENRVGESLLED